MKTKERILAGHYGTPGSAFLTTKQLAKEAGVAIVTAHRIMMMLREEKIIELVGRGYVLSQVAGKEVSARRIGILFPRLDNPFFAQLVDELTRLGARRGLELQIAASDYDSRREAEALNRFVAAGVGGILACPGIEPETAHLYANLPIPAVFIARHLDGASNYAVVAQNFMGGQLAARHLLEMGYTDFAYLGLRRDTDFRLDGFRFALNEAGHVLPVGRIITLTDWTSPAAEEALLEHLPSLPQPLGLFCFHDLIAVGALRAAQKQGWRVPEDLAVIGFDDLPVATEVRPALTSLGYPTAEMARLSLDLLASLLSGETSASECKTVYLEPRLAVRQSTVRTSQETFEPRRKVFDKTYFFDCSVQI